MTQVEPHAATTMDRPTRGPLPKLLVEKNSSNHFFSVAASAVRAGVGNPDAA